MTVTKRKLYTFDDHPEHEARLGEWRDRWIANAMSTAAMTEEDRAACTRAVHGMYAAARRPPPKHVVFVPSPFVLAFAGGFAAAIWHGRKATPKAELSTGDATGDATWAATRAATRDATGDATGDATWAATRAATGDATRAATGDATRAATRAATGAATGAATWDATGDATGAATWDATRAATWAATGDATGDAKKENLSKWYVVPADMRALAHEIGVGDFGLRCAAEAFRMWQHGNQESGYDAYLSFFQDVAGLDLPQYDAYRHWRTLAERSGPRIVHPDFCMISDRPELLKVDDERRPHAEAGPFCRWRDGSALYSWHGQRVPAAWLEGAPPTAAEALHWRDMDQRAAACEIVGWHNILDQLSARCIDDSGDPVWGRLVEVDLPDSGRERFLDALCGTGRRFALPVPPKTRSVDEAQSALHGGLPASILRFSVART